MLAQGHWDAKAQQLVDTLCRGGQPSAHTLGVSGWEARQQGDGTVQQASTGGGNTEEDPLGLAAWRGVFSDYI